MTPKLRRLGAACLISALLSSPALAQESPPKFKLQTKETLLTKLEQTFMADSLVVSPDMKRVAYLDDRGKQKKVVVDGRAVATYVDAFPSSLRFSPDGKRLAYVASKNGKLLSMADMNMRTGRFHHVLTAVGGDLTVVVDRTEYNGFQAIDPDSLRFSPDSNKVAFVGRKGPVGWKLYIDGVESGESWDDIACLPTQPAIRFSPDGVHMAYAAIRNDRWFVVTDGRPSAPYDAIVDDTIVFSPDGKRIAFAAVKGDSQFVVLDGKEQTPYSLIAEGSLVFSADSKHFGYLVSRSVGTNATACLAVIDGKPGKELTQDGAGFPKPTAIHPERFTFSPDGTRYAWALWNSHEKRTDETAEIGAQVIVDGVVSDEFRSLLSDLHFSPDGKRLAYVAAKGNPPPPDPYGDVRLVVDGKESRRFYAIDYPSVCFSPDSRYAVCIGFEPSGRPRLVVNGAEGKEFLNFVAAAPYGQTTTPLPRKTEVVFTGPRTMACAVYVHWTIVRLETTIIEE